MIAPAIETTMPAPKQMMVHSAADRTNAPSSPERSREAVSTSSAASATQVRPGMAIS